MTPSQMTPPPHHGGPLGFLSLRCRSRLFCSALSTLSRTTHQEAVQGKGIVLLCFISTDAGGIQGTEGFPRGHRIQNGFRLYSQPPSPRFTQVYVRCLTGIIRTRYTQSSTSAFRRLSHRCVRACACEFQCHTFTRLRVKLHVEIHTLACIICAHRTGQTGRQSSGDAGLAADWCPC